jgi:hypothetical protein
MVVLDEVPLARAWEPFQSFPNTRTLLVMAVVIALIDRSMLPKVAFPPL